MQVHGVDFSGAARAGEKIWLASATDDGETLRVESVRSAAEAFGPDRETAHAGLREFVGSRDTDEAVGLDCSFGLPRGVHDADSWPAFVEWFAEAFDSPDALQGDLAERTKRRTGGERTYLKRRTDARTGARSPYHWLVGTQTFYGIRDIIAPLADCVSIEPLAPRAEAASLLEIYPASTLRALDLPSQRYKNDATYPEAPARRETILDGLREWGVVLDEELDAIVLNDSGGDALDSVVAAVAVARAARDDFEVRDRDAYDPVEGYIYV
ncbi:DUF429 domain-containing protein [Halorarius litoreus]|uniref:DUF429 domain-containing protein n=1 Tax=Halorarius litoreus TaxID=2962676 RepID=UPI0020CC4BF4|nr:DUF429 domain-containing protein [Halorarius litoreus]